MRLLLLLLAWMAIPSQAAAYIDPGSGSYAFQVIIATLAGFFYLIAHSWRRLFALFRRSVSGTTEVSGKADEEPADEHGEGKTGE